jgi:hypothetical protein
LGLLVQPWSPGGQNEKASLIAVLYALALGFTSVATSQWLEVLVAVAAAAVLAAK